MSIEFREEELPIIYVEFYDHVGDDAGGWHPIDFIRAKNTVGNCKAVGFLIKEDDVSLTISMLYGELDVGYADDGFEKQVNSPLTIIKGAIVYRTVLETKKRMNK